MIFVILGLIIGLIMITYMLYDTSETIIGKILSFICGIPFGALIGGLIGSLIAIITGGILYLIDIPQERLFISETPIYSVIDNQSFDGNFILGCGTISSSLKYYYIIKDEYGNKVSSTDMGNTHIINTNGEPKIKKYHTDFKNQKWCLIGFNCKEKDDYILEVPNNTIKYNYNIDLK